MTKPSRSLSYGREALAGVSLKLVDSAHCIEHHAHRPVQVFAATGEHDVLRAMADHVRGGADAVRRGRAGADNE